MSKESNYHTGSNVARANKVRAGHLPLRESVKSMLGGKRLRKDKRKSLNLGEWNVRTLLDRTGTERPERQTALVALELNRYNIDIAALSETRFPDYDSMVDHGYTFFWSGKSRQERRESGVGFAIRNEIACKLEQEPSAVNDRIMTMRLPLRKRTYATIISIYAPTMTNPDDAKEYFYSKLEEVVRKVPAGDKLLLVGDFNARVGDDAAKWPRVIEGHGMGKCNSNGELLLAFCSENELVITNTIFRHKESHKATWMHPRSKHWHLIDFVITRQKDRNDVMDTRAMRGADCSTDHLMLRTKIKFSIDNKHNKSGARPPKKLAGKELRNNKTKAALVEELNKALEGWNNSDRDKNIEDCWSELKTTVYDTAEKVIPKQKRKHQDWFDENDGRLKVLIETRNAAREQQLQRNTRASKARYLKARNELQRYTSQMKSDWWEMKAMALQLAADMNNMKEFYSGLREIYGPQLRGSTQLISADGATVLQEKEEILDRFADHFSQLLNIPGELDEEAKDNIEQKEIVTSLDDPPNLGEILTAISNISEGKAPGRDGIPAEIWKYGGNRLTECLQKLVEMIWETGKVPQDWKDADIIPIFKKGDKRDCGNYRGISLLSIVGKILARVLLNRLNEHIAQNVLPETQCGFRSGRGTIDMIFCLRQVQEKCVEQNMPLYVVFIDFSKAFDTVSRQGLWCVLKKYGCTERFINLIEALHTGMQASVSMCNTRSKEFEVTNGVKQGCVLAPTLFSIYLAAMLEVAFKDSTEGVYIQTRKDADLFNISHFKAKTKTRLKIVREMLFADDSALVAHSEEDIQHLVDRFAGAATQFSLKINIKKTECLYQPPKFHSAAIQPAVISINSEPLTSCKHFTYLGSTASENARIDQEIASRMGKASAAFGKLQSRLWKNRHVTIEAKCKVYRAVVLSTLLYGAETWTVYRTHVKKLHGYMMRQLRNIMNISWQDKVTNKDILKRAGLPSMADLLIKKNLRWLGHVERMDHERLPRQLLYSQLSEGVRNQGRPRLRFKDVCKRNMKWKDIDLNNWKQSAVDRQKWRSMIGD